MALYLGLEKARREERGGGVGRRFVSKFCSKKGELKEGGKRIEH